MWVCFLVLWLCFPSWHVVKQQDKPSHRPPHSILIFCRYAASNPWQAWLPTANTRCQTLQSLCETILLTSPTPCESEPPRRQRFRRISLQNVRAKTKHDKFEFLKMMEWTVVECATRTYVIWIAAKVRAILFHPFQGQTLIFESSVAGYFQFGIVHR